MGEKKRKMERRKERGKLGKMNAISSLAIKEDK